MYMVFTALNKIENFGHKEISQKFDIWLTDVNS